MSSKPGASSADREDLRTPGHGHDVPTNPGTPESPEEIAPKTDEVAEDTSAKLTEITPAPIREYTPSYDHELTTERITESSEQIERMRQYIESDEVTMMQLQGGWEWMKTPMGRDVEHDEKYARMAQIYLRKQGDSFVVQNELDNIYKTKMGIGAGDLLPPSITKVAITDLSGNRRIGVRETRMRRGYPRVGYYDKNGYIPIFGGHKITPMELIKEDSEQCKSILLSERQSYIDKKEAAEEEEEAMTKGSDDVRDYQRERFGVTSEQPVASLRDLRTKTNEQLEDAGLGKKEVREISNARLDLRRTEALLEIFGIRISSSSEMQGGAYFVEMNGKVAEMLGWTHDMTKKEKEFLKKAEEEGIPKDKRASWALNQTALLAKNPENYTNNNTVKLILAMQTGRIEFPPGYRFIGSYELKITELHELHRLANEDMDELLKILNRLGGKTRRINPDKVIQSTLEVSTPSYLGMNIQEAIRYARSHNIRPLLGGGGHKTLEALFASGNGKIKKVNYDFNALSKKMNCTDSGSSEGKKCCAFMVSRLLGLRRSDGKGLDGSVNSLVPKLIHGILEKTGGRSAGIIFGFENFRKGDVVVWNGYKNVKRYSHVGVVRDVITLQGEKFIAIQHDYKHLEIDLVPVNPHVNVRRFRRYLTPSGLAELPSSASKSSLESMIQYRSGFSGLVQFRSPSGWFGDSSRSSGGKIGFAVRASILEG